VPTLFGGNFQAVSVATKTYGYVAGSLAFTPQLITAFDFVDAFPCKVVAALKAKGIYDDTLITVASKHGQAPIDPSCTERSARTFSPQTLAFPVDFITTDDVALIFLKDQRDTDKAVVILNGSATH